MRWEISRPPSVGDFCVVLDGLAGRTLLSLPVVYTAQSAVRSAQCAVSCDDTTEKYTVCSALHNILDLLMQQPLRPGEVFFLYMHL